MLFRRRKRIPQKTPLKIVADGQTALLAAATAAKNGTPRDVFEVYRNRPDLILGAALVAAHTLANPEVCAALVAAIATDQTATVQESITIEFFDAQFEEDW